MITTSFNFPSNISGFLRENYALEYQNDILRTDMLSGRARQRRQFENAPAQTNVSLLLSNSEAQIFEAWYRYDIKSYNWFNATLRSPTGIKSIVCRFRQRYSGPVLTGNKWRYQCSLEIYEQDIISQDWYEYAKEFILYAGGIDFAISEEWPEA